LNRHPSSQAFAAPQPPTARSAVQSLGASRIREVANAGIGRADILPFWFGEPDEVTPAFIREAAKTALDAGDTFYTPNLGLPELRETIAAYQSALHGGGQPIAPDRVAVTSSGVSALMLLSQLVLGPGDRVVAVTPLWPNLVEIPRILGADVVCVPLRFDAAGPEPLWQLDLQQLLDALTPGTRAVFINSPNNPTGWVITREQQQAVLAHCRRHGIWIMADDVYERLMFDADGAHGRHDTHGKQGTQGKQGTDSDRNIDGRPPSVACAPSFLDLAGPDDRLISANSFSKSWLMTGWRLGWAVVPPGMTADLAKLIEYNTSCAPGFVQRAGIVAIQQGEEVIARTNARYREARDFLYGELTADTFRRAGISVPRPRGAMYLFFRIDGEGDSLSLCKRLAAQAGLGLAPGSAFGPEGEGHVRWCFASSVERLQDGVRRLADFLGR
jgi:aspartate/methionine/tyrosine aminotransferase